MLTPQLETNDILPPAALPHIRPGGRADFAGSADTLVTSEIVTGQR
ncbi:hypothetical protein HR059_07375 [Sinorhizobium meliloti WSM1022]|nr:hypothetical protein [Sinorhizobium meliloti]QKN14294.1 hypothetical protein HR059_07375 [Sinorhizobium meliloti WSM1022]